ncbi:hypothetical protein ACFLWZ_02425 [Chloroflexota bacterium]
MSRNDIQVIIVFDPDKVNECGISCGEGWDSAEVIELARQRVKVRFGDEIRLKCLDLSKSGTASLSLELQQKIGEGILTLPLLIINDEPRISGQFDIRLLLDAIEAEIEIGR